MVESLARALPREWPKFLRWMEHKLRHKAFKLSGTATTPYACVHGFSGSAALQSSLAALEQNPEDLVTHPWLLDIFIESQRVSDALATTTEATAKARAQKQHESNTLRQFQAGELVLLQKPFYEKGQGLILPQCDGPFVVARVPGDHNVTLADPLAGSAYLNGKKRTDSVLALCGWFHSSIRWRPCRITLRGLLIQQHFEQQSTTS